MKKNGPIATLAAVAVLGTGLWLVNANEQSAPAPAPAAVTAPAAAPTNAAPTVRPAPVTPAPVPFGAQEDFVADIPIKTGNLALEIRVSGTKAWAYACDNEDIEVWLSGSAVDGVLNLASADKLSRLEGSHRGNTVVGNFRLGEKSWSFTAVPGDTSVF